MEKLIKPDLSILFKSWPSAYVAREETKRFSGGILNPKTLANLDSAGLGPAGRFRVGRKIVYPVSSLIKFLEDRSQLVGPKGKKGEQGIES